MVSTTFPRNARCPPASINRTPAILATAQIIPIRAARPEPDDIGKAIQIGGSGAAVALRSATFRD
jgi:hypothetical protein